jgi:hypothetical protein
MSFDQSLTPLGHDVASVKGDFWSIVEDFSDSKWAVPYRSQLNSNGLFDSCEVALQYLQEYQDHKEADFDMGLEPVFLARVNLKT